MSEKPEWCRDLTQAQLDYFEDHGKRRVDYVIGCIDRNRESGKSALVFLTALVVATIGGLFNLIDFSDGIDRFESCVFRLFISYIGALCFFSIYVAQYVIAPAKVNGPAIDPFKTIEEEDITGETDLGMIRERIIYGQQLAIDGNSTTNSELGARLRVVWTLIPASILVFVLILAWQIGSSFPNT